MVEPYIQERKDFYQQMGRCIAAWSHIEDYLFHICHAALGCTLQHAAIVYGRLRLIDMRLELTNELVISVLPKRKRQSGGHDHPDVKAWTSLFKETKALLPTRNAIAHRPVIQIVPLGTPSSDIQGLLASLEVGEGLLFMPGEPGMAIIDHELEHPRGREENAHLTTKSLETHLKDVQALYTRYGEMSKVVRKARRAGRPRRKAAKSPN